MSSRKILSLTIAAQYVFSNFLVVLEICFQLVSREEHLIRTWGRGMNGPHREW